MDDKSRSSANIPLPTTPRISREMNIKYSNNRYSLFNHETRMNYQIRHKAQLHIDRSTFHVLKSHATSMNREASDTRQTKSKVWSCWLPHLVNLRDAANLIIHIVGLPTKAKVLLQMLPHEVSSPAPALVIRPYR